VPGPYPPEFKREAVDLYRSSEKSIPKVTNGLNTRRLGSRLLPHAIL
jgi:transposase-like protein